MTGRATGKQCAHMAGRQSYDVRESTVANGSVIAMRIKGVGR